MTRDRWARLGGWSILAAVGLNVSSCAATTTEDEEVGEVDSAVIAAKAFSLRLGRGGSGGRLTFNCSSSRGCERLVHFQFVDGVTWGVKAHADRGTSAPPALAQQFCSAIDTSAMAAPALFGSEIVSLSLPGGSVGPSAKESTSSAGFVGFVCEVHKAPSLVEFRWDQYTQLVRFPPGKSRLQIKRSKETDVVLGSKKLEMKVRFEVLPRDFWCDSEGEEYPDCDPEY